MKSYRLPGIPVVLLLLVMQGSSTAPPVSYPPPVVEPGGTLPGEPVRPVTPGSIQAQPPRTTASISSPAVVALLGQAENRNNFV